MTSEQHEIKQPILIMWDAALLFVVSIGLFAHLYWFENKFRIEGDSARDYLVARHIVKYRELPTLGPWNGVSYELRNSPVYYYLLSILVFVKDDILFLGKANVLLQFFGTIALYLLGRSIFGSAAAFVGTALYYYSFLVVNQSMFVWQPHVAQPFAILGYLGLVRFYVFRRWFYLWAGIVSFILSASLHLSYLSAVLFTAVFVIFILKHHRIKNGEVVAVLYVFFLTLLTLYSPVLSNVVILNRSINWPGLVYGESFTLFLSKIFSSIVFLFENALFSGFDGGAHIKTAAFVFLFIFFIVSYVSLRRMKATKALFLVLMVFLIQPILFLAMFRTEPYIHYLTPAFAPFFLALGVLIFAIMQKHRLFGVLCGLLLLYGSSGRFFLFRNYVDSQSISYVTLISDRILREVGRLQEDGDRDAPSNFTIAQYKEDFGKTFFDGIWWAQLEKQTGRKFVNIVDSGNSYMPTNGSSYIFVVCEKQSSASEYRACENLFLGDYPRHELVRLVYEDDFWRVTLARRAV